MHWDLLTISKFWTDRLTYEGKVSTRYTAKHVQRYLHIMLVKDLHGFNCLYAFKWDILQYTFLKENILPGIKTDRVRYRPVLPQVIK